MIDKMLEYASDKINRNSKQKLIVTYAIISITTGVLALLNHQSVIMGLCAGIVYTGMFQMYEKK